MKVGKGLCVEMHPMKWRVLLFAELFAELLVTIRLLAAQMKIAMDGFQLIAQTVQHPQQTHTVGTSRECYQIAMAGVQQLMACDEIADFIFERVSHATSGVCRLGASSLAYTLLINYSTYNTSPFKYSPSG